MSLAALAGRRTVAVVAMSSVAYDARSVLSGTADSYTLEGTPFVLYRIGADMQVAWFQSVTANPDVLIEKICRVVPNVEWLFVLGTAVGRKEVARPGAVLLTSTALCLDRQGRCLDSTARSVSPAHKAKVEAFMLEDADKAADKAATFASTGRTWKSVAYEVVQRLVDAPNKTATVMELREILKDDDTFRRVCDYLDKKDAIEVLTNPLAFKLLNAAAVERPEPPVPAVVFGQVLTSPYHYDAEAGEKVLASAGPEAAGLDTVSHKAMDVDFVNHDKVGVLPVAQVIDSDDDSNVSVDNAAAWLHRFIQWLSK